MLQYLIIVFLGLALQNFCFLAETTEQGNRCDKKSVLTIRTECQSCSLNFRAPCPDGYRKITNGSVGVRDCRYTFEIKSYSLSLPGCRHICRKDYLQPQCCPGRWGPDCLECPGGAGSPCSGRGSCAEGMDGNGSCSCQEGFGGTACETCAHDNVFGLNCSSVCKCVHGVCNSGLHGSGTCECYSAYTGPTCDTPAPECEALLCPENSRCSPGSEDETKLECRCLPGYKGDGKNCEPINPCLQQPCHPHAHCAYLGPNRHSCTCREGYLGDGHVCLPLDPCQTDFGNCPPTSTMCKYDGPGQSHCECKEHYHNFVPGVGCTTINVCESKNPCHRNANCTTVAPGRTKCACQKGYVGDGLACYGNILERLQELDTMPGGEWQGKLTSFIFLLDKAYSWPLSALGPFTLLVPLEKEPKAFSVKELLVDPEAARYFVKLHIIAGQMSTDRMNSTNTFYTLTGASGEIFHLDQGNQIKLELHKGKKKVKIVEGNIIASNGLIHILDRAMDKIEPTLQSSSEQTIMTMLQPRYSKFRSLLEETDLGRALDEDGAGGPYTVFVPSNEALNTMKDGVLEYLLSPEGSRKRLELVRYHVVPFTQLEVATLVSAPHIRSLANQIIWFNTTDNGRILANGVAMEDTEVTAKNGRIYTLAGVLIPPSIVPILPHRCDETKSEMRLGSCVSCSLVFGSKCPPNSEPTAVFTNKCIYGSRIGSLKSGCARYCNATVRIPKCCRGFYGPDCNQCPSGFSNPCSGNGQCADGIGGNGTCNCKDGFQGSQCQLCSDSNKYGPRCDKKCLCARGTCDNRVDSDGGCLPGTCQDGSVGRLCDRQPSACGHYAQFCHIHATCKYNNGTASCVCKDGYEGDGIMCSKRDPCADSTRGGCSRNAECIRTGPESHTCVCQRGWTGTGRDCMEINNCLLPSKGGCHDNATCLYVGPGQNECECQKGFRGNGIDCKPIISCLEQTWKCHPLATCRIAASGVWSCVCQEGYKGDGILCYGNAAMELSFLSKAATFNQWINNASLQPMLSTTSNLTVLVPSQQAVEDMDQDEKNFWLSRSNIPALIKYHTLLGTYGVTDLQTLPSSDMLATSLQGSFLRLEKADGNATIGGANIIDGDNVATNGMIHIIDKVLVPQRSLSGSLPNLLARLDQMPDYSTFRSYIIHYNLANAIEAADAYTIFAPNNAALEDYVKTKKATSLEDTLRYHVVLEEKLLKNDLRNGMHRETMLGPSYLLGFFLHNDQLYVNEAPVNYTNVATDKGVIHGLGKVLEIQKNRCDNNETTVVQGMCGKCSQQPICPPGTKPRGNEKRRCIYDFYFEQKRSAFIGCQTTCVRTVFRLACCAGFFGPQCQACPGPRGNACFGNGICMDGVNGTGVCKCDPGFHGTACETCVDGKYGVHCDQACSCVHGRCSQGPEGDGSCDCDVGWRGPRCDSATTDDSCNGTCHTSANCLLTPDGTASCRCAAGFQGNGTMCKAINPCETRNGGCSSKADCKKTTPGNRVCLCKAGYTGDGVACLEINPCLENHGGCDRNAECTHTGANQAVCNCLPTYTGDGKVCTLINVCLTKNGGCSPYAICNHTATGERTCSCKQNYTGDGFTCRGYIYEELPKNPQTSQYFFQLQEHSVKELAGPGPFTVFAPLSAAFDEEHEVKSWHTMGLMPQVLRYHVVACHQLLLENLKLTPNVTSLQGQPITISVSQDTVYINNKAKIISSDIINTNGVIHIIDKLLTPQKWIITLRDATGRIMQDLKMVATHYGYKQFSKLLQDTGLLSVITDPIHTPVTLFWPTDRALQALPQEQRDFLFNQDNKEKLKGYLKFHVIRDAKVLTVDLLRSASWKTLQGSELSVKCGDGSNIGDLFLNGQKCRIVQRELLFDVGVAYGIDCLLIDPTLGGRCDSFATFNVLGNCGSCFDTPRCPKGTKPKGMKQKCLYGMQSFERTLEGCQNKCTLVTQLPRCCKGYFLPNCQACPGGPDTPCSNQGFCLEQSWPDGQCLCNPGFNGTACELCELGRFGPNCEPCGCSDHGHCDDGITGSGQCLCESGWTGRFCETQTAVPPVCMPPCSAHATCMENNVCECDLNYEGDGITCTVVDFCKQNNGGCAEVAKCSQTDTKVSCSCPTGYQGDGHSCTEIDPCVDGLNGGCHEHAICKRTGPGRRECECKSHYVGDGLHCEPEQLPLDRCLENNGYCHQDAECTDLHFQDSTAGVFHLRSPLGQYKLTFLGAIMACAHEAATVATYSQLANAQKAGYHLCSAGWLYNGHVAYPTAYASRKCGGGLVGIVDYGARPNKSEVWDVFCYRRKAVKCTCKVGYVGDGYSCHGNLLQELMYFPSFKNFLTEVLAYSNRSARGRAFVERLTDPSLRSTLFVPSNSGLEENETLSGQDIEHHLLNVSRFFYNDLINGTVLQTGLGSQLRITCSQDQLGLRTWFVDESAILLWDLIATNGVIHIISKPLKAPPPPTTSTHAGFGTGIFFAIILVIGAITLAAYSYFRLNRRAIGFQRFESEEDIDVAALSKQPPENISNPTYESAPSPPPPPPCDHLQELDTSDLLGAGTL